MDIGKMFSLESKTALVTGVSNDTGLCHSMAMALNEAGAAVMLLDISPDVHKMAAQFGGAAAGFYSVQCDLCDESSLNAAVDSTISTLGKIDILLNGAGIQFRNEAISYPADKWKSIVDVNLSASFFAAQAVARHMLERGSGKIINVASMTSFIGSKNIPAYSASKGGVMQLTKALSNEWCSGGINVNAIAPGYMSTKLTEDLIDTEYGKYMTTRIPAGRWGKGDDLKGAVVFLASAASDYVSGAIIPVDGGFLGF